jgi:hypothetical protein
MGFVRPWDRIALRPLAEFGLCNISREPHGVTALIALHRLLNDAGIPHGVQVSLTAHECHRHVIAATVVIVGDVQWLVDIPDEMNQIFKGFESQAFWGLPVCQDALELFNLCNNASVVWTIVVAFGPASAAAVEVGIGVPRIDLDRLAIVRDGVLDFSPTGWPWAAIRSVSVPLCGGRSMRLAHRDLLGGLYPDASGQSLASEVDRSLEPLV